MIYISEHVPTTLNLSRHVILANKRLRRWCRHGSWNLPNDCLLAYWEDLSRSPLGHIDVKVTSMSSPSWLFNDSWLEDAIDTLVLDINN